ncbi:MAG: penicillin-binding protein 2 [Acidimicrobiales bacterium]
MATEPGDNTQLRLAVIGVVCVSLFASLFVRLYYLQVIDHQNYTVEARAVHLRTKHEQGPRGRILDRNGNVLVDNKVTVVVGIDKEVSRARGMGNGDSSDDDKQKAKRKRVFRQLAVLLTGAGLPTKVTNLERLYTDVRYGPNDFLPIVDDHVSEALQAYLAEHHDEFPGVVAKSRTVRVYPYGNLAAHLLGYVGQVTPTDLALDSVKAEGTPAKPAGPDAKPYAPDDEIGKSGVERAFEKYLRGKPGDTVIQVDARGQRIGTVRSPELAQGDDVWLSIDINEQALVEQQLAAQIAARAGSDCEKGRRCTAHEGSAVILDPRNGEVLAMASYPTFDPSKLVNGISTELWEQLNSKATFKPMLNRAMAESYAPGSTFKLVTTHAALTKGVITPEYVWHDTGKYKLEGCTGGKCEFQNADAERLGNVNLQQAITQSSDTYYYRLGDLLWRGRAQYGDTAIQDSAKEFGFGQKTGINLPSESPGLIATPEWLAGVYAKNPKLWDHGDWKVGDNVNAAIGQGMINVTPLQLANAYATFANGGTRYVPQIALKVTRPKSLSADIADLHNVTLVKSFDPQIAGKVEFPNPDQYGVVYRGLQGVTANPSGTAYKAFRQSPTAWPLAGKTGTAQVTHKLDTSVFVGFGPATGFEPAQFAMASIIPEAGFGADASAPLVFSVLRHLSDNTVPVVGHAAPQQAETGTPVSVPPTTAPPTTLPLATTTTAPSSALKKSTKNGSGK